jgi:citrate lyase subunit beta/citryl-CoA lyase
MRPRSLLFVPADSERKLTRALSSSADALILDLQDGVAPTAKAQARANARATLQAAAGASRPQLWVRINALATPEAPLDVAATVPGRPFGKPFGKPFGLVVPMIEHPADLVRLSETLRRLESESSGPGEEVRLMALLETPRAILNVPQYLSVALPRLVGIIFGAEDLSAALGLQTTRAADGDWCAPLQSARAQCLLLARALGVDAIEAITAQFKDTALLRADCARAAAAGFTGKLAIHPDQLEIINSVFTPTEAALAQARRVVAAFEAQPGAGALALDGALIDGVHLRAAQRLLDE